MDNCIIIVIGATGDLAKRKLIPALYRLFVDKNIEKFLLVGAAREQLTGQEFIAQSRAAMGACNESEWEKFATHMRYHQVDVYVEQDWQRFAQFVNQQEGAGNFSGCRLLYIATASTLFVPITDFIASSGLIKRTQDQDSVWHRIVYEKPFGRDASSAHAINKTITDHFYEHQVYRIDHYLTKELVHNIMQLRFANTIFEPLWNAHGIEEVQIVLSEKSTIAGRALFYDAYGALRDVVQNHMLQLLALIAMEPPKSLHSDDLCNARAQVLQKTQIVDGLLGQANVYQQEDGVKKDSRTETFALLRLSVENERWSGVPFYFKTGKYLAKHETVIHLKFRQSAYAHLFMDPPPANWLTIKIAPDEIFSLYFNIKTPRCMRGLTSVALEFCHSCIFVPHSMYAYEILFDEVMRGQCLASVSIDEIDQAWRIIDDAYNKNLPLYVYQQGSEGPAQADDFAQTMHLRWRS